MTISINTERRYVPFPLIDAEAGLAFRWPRPDRDADLKNELAQFGQLTTLVVEERDGRYLVLDGHRRYDALSRLRDESGWNDVAVHVVPPLNEPERCRIIGQLNLTGQNPYGLMERARFFAAFYRRSVSVRELQAWFGVSRPDLQDYLFISEAPERLAQAMNDTRMDPLQAALLLERYRACRQGAWAAFADDIADRVVEQARAERMSRRAWEFCLDFYWGKERPFLVPAVR